MKTWENIFYLPTLTVVGLGLLCFMIQRHRATRRGRVTTPAITATVKTVKEETKSRKHKYQTKLDIMMTLTYQGISHICIVHVFVK